MSNDLLSAPNTPKDISRLLQDKPVAIVPPLVSIVIPCCGMVEYTEMCVPSILKNTRMPFELIFLDIGSLDGTADLLRGLRMGLHQIRMEVVRTPTDLGIPKACEEALERCRGEFIVLLNNDTIVTRGWVNQFILSKKVRQQGYNLGVCQDVFIHHFGTRTFAHGSPSTPVNGQP